MPNFDVTLKFKEISLVPPPKLTDLLFYDAKMSKLARGWIDENGGLVLIGAKWTPTHYAEHYHPIINAEIRARHLLANSTKEPTRLAFDSVREKYLVVQRCTEPERVLEGKVVAASDSEYLARQDWAAWCTQPEENCWYEFVLNVKAR